MNRLGRFLTSPVQDRAGVQVDALVHRASESSFPGDRKEAVAELRDLLAESSSARIALGTTGFPLLLALAGEGVDLDRLLFECLAFAVFLEENGSVNGQMLARTPGALTVLLHNLQPGVDFYVQYHSLQVLRGVVAASPFLVQEHIKQNKNTNGTVQAVQGQPLGVGALLDLLTSGHEVLRNEVLILLARLLPGAPELAKLVVFEGGFDRLLDIAREEGLGGSDGPASLVACDCLDLAAVLVEDNPATLRMLWEGGHLTPLLGLQAGGPQGSQPHVLPLVRLVRAATAPSRAPPGRYSAGLGEGDDTRRHVLEATVAAGWLPGLLRLGLTVPVGEEASQGQEVQAEALLCLTGMLTDAPAVAASFLVTSESSLAATLALPPTSTAPALLLAALLGGRLTPAVAAGARRALEAAHLDAAALLGFVVDGRGARLAAYLAPDPRCFEAADQAGPGAAVCGAAAALAALADALLLSSAAQRVAALHAQPAPPGHATLMDGLAASLAAATSAAASTAPESPRAGPVRAFLASGLGLLLAWASGSPPVTAAFLAAAARAPFLMDAVGGRGVASDPRCRGLAALVLGSCAADGAAAADDAAAATAAKLAAVIRGPAMGSATFRGLVDGLTAHAAVRQASHAALLVRDDDGDAPPFPVYSPRWASALARRAQIVLAAMFGGPEPEPEGGVADCATGDAWGRGGEVVALHAATENGVGNGAHGPPSGPPRYEPADTLQPHSQSLQPLAALPPARPGAQLLQAPQQPDTAPGSLSAPREAESRAEACSAETASARAALADAQAEAGVLRGTVSRLEGEMQDLASAYASLDSHAAQLQAALDEQEARLSAHGAGAAATPPQHAPPIPSFMEHDEDELTDLLVCLGQEEAKVALLCSRLQEFGVDTQALLDSSFPPTGGAPDDLT